MKPIHDYNIGNISERCINIMYSMTLAYNVSTLTMITLILVQ